MSKFTVYFARHGRRPGIRGRTERTEGVKRLYSCPEVDHLYASPAIRCRETAAILYPGMEPEDSPYFQANTK